MCLPEHHRFILRVELLPFANSQHSDVQPLAPLLHHLSHPLKNRHDQLLALLTAGADPAAADYDTRTALHVAARIGAVLGWRSIYA